MKRTVYVPLVSLAWRGRWHSVDRHHLNRQGGGGPDSHRHLPERNKVLDQEGTMLHWIKSQLSRFVFETCAILMFSLHLDTSNLFCSRISEQHRFWQPRKSSLTPTPCVNLIKKSTCLFCTSKHESRLYSSLWWF